MYQAYRGAIGRTRSATVHVTDARGALVPVQVYTSIDAAADPALAERLRRGTLNELAQGGATLQLAVPVLYHDPAAGLLVLVLGDAHRHRELEERIAVLAQLRDDPAEVPTYAKDFAVVFGAAGLRAHLEQQARARDVAAELDAARAELELLRARDTDQFAAEVLADEVQIEAVSAADIEAEIAIASEPTAGSTDRAGEAEPEVEILVDGEPQFDAGDEPATAVDPGRGSPSFDAVTTEVHERSPDEVSGAGAADLAAYRESACHLADAGVQLIVVGADRLAAAGPLDVRLVLHRTPSYPVIALVVGPASALRAPDPDELAIVALDIGAERDRGVLHALARRFELTVLVVSAGRCVRACQLTAPLADNTSYVLRAADAHLRAIAAEGPPSFPHARALVLGADVLGSGHPEHSEFRDDRIAQLSTARKVRRALAIAARFTRPPHEDYLICTRGYPLARWHRLRRDVLERAVAWGLWMGPELAQVAVSEGLARSRRDLVTRLERGFDGLRHDPGAFDLDAEAAADNLTAIADEARALGVALRLPRLPHLRGGGAIASDTAPVVSGSIGETPPHGTPASPTTEQWIAQLEAAGARDGVDRVAAALRLCDHGDPRAAPAVVDAVLKMSRGEAVRVLPRLVRLGAAAVPGLIGALASSKAFLRQGAALALAHLGTDDATRAVVDLLVAEPTELWREIARAIGEIGAPALAVLIRVADDRLAAASAERIAWAMAHLGARGCRAAVAALAVETSVVTPIATMALELVAPAASDPVRDPSGLAQPDVDLTVNRAFSRQFFEALEQVPAAPGVGDLVESPSALAGEP